MEAWRALSAPIDHPDSLLPPMTSEDRTELPQEDEQLLFTVSTVWREERVSCPHPDLLRAYVAGNLDGGAVEFLQFHLDEAQCPYCNAIVEELRAVDRDAQQATGDDLDGLEGRLRASTAAALSQRRSQS